MSYLKLALIFGVALGFALFLIPTAALGVPGGVGVHVDQSMVTSPGNASGLASSPLPGTVTVRATIDGVEIAGSPDSTMEGGMNDFDFDIPEGNAGKILVITAIGPDGSTTRRRMTIR